MHLKFALLIILLSLMACSNSSSQNEDQTTDNKEQNIDWQGHRGARGLLPENTIPAFLLALEFPQIKTLELDLAVSKDNKLVVSHEPWMSATICLHPNGEEIPEAEEEQHRIYEMTYEELRLYDCGSRKHPRFPEQKQARLPKPLLRQVVEAAEEYSKTLGRPLPYYNIEIKSKPEWDKAFCPEPEVFAQLLWDELQVLNIVDRAVVQSFDPRSLRAMHSIAPELKSAFLVENTLSFKKNLEELGFIPEIYSPNHLLVSANLVDEVHKKAMKLIPWTVNKTIQMEGLLSMGVDGIITDYPNRIPLPKIPD